MLLSTVKISEKQKNGNKTGWHKIADRTSREHKSVPLRNC